LAQSSSTKITNHKHKYICNSISIRAEKCVKSQEMLRFNPTHEVKESLKIVSITFYTHMHGQNRTGRSGFDSRQGLGIFLFAPCSDKPTQPLIQWVPGALSAGEKRPGTEAYWSPTSSAEFRKDRSYTSNPHTPWRGALSSGATSHYL
jgi:hypothetical protein